MKNKWTITLERRDDGGLRVWSEDIPGFVLSSRNQNAVLWDMGGAIKVFLDHFDMAAPQPIERFEDGAREGMEK